MQNSHIPVDEAKVERVLLAYVRAEFLAPAAAIIGLIDLVREDARRLSLAGYEDDLDRMHGAAVGLSQMIESLFGDEAAAMGATSASDDDSGSRTLRHNLKTPVTAIIGYAELLAEEASDDGHHALLPALADVLDAAGRLLSAIDKMVEHTALSASHSDGTTLGAPPAVLRQAMQVVRQLAQENGLRGEAPSGRILIVDDNPSILDLLSRRLAREGHQVVTCQSGERALRLTAESPFDLVLLDVMMPGMTGIEALQRLKTAAPALPVIMISALDELETIVRCVEEGADDYLSKPVNTTLLRARVATSLDRKFLRDREQATTLKLRAEQERSETLLRNVLPDVIVDRLGRGEAVEADHFDHATILFCDLVGFTTLTAAWTPGETLKLLNEIFLGFDQLVVSHRLEKIKTIGDAYMVAGGLPEPHPDHARAIVSMALDMPGIVAEAARRRGVDLDVRIGVATGPVIAGIIGQKKFFYDVWGDTVNTASRMEALSAPGRIQITRATRDAIGTRFDVEPRGVIEVKGKGDMEAFFVLGDRQAAPDR